MSFHRESQHERYDVVVIGAGVGGLTAGALLARAGCSVLVIERHDRPGGYLHGFARRGFWFDAGVHSVGGCAAVGPFYRRALGMLVEGLGLCDRVRLLPVDPVARVCFPGLETTLPQGLTRLQEHLAEVFPRERQAVSSFLTLAEGVADEAARAAAGLSGQWQWLPSYRHATLGEVLAQHLKDPQLAAVLAGLWPYMGLPPGRLTARVRSSVWRMPWPRPSRREAGTPRTMERYTLNHLGAAYGWAPTPRQVGPGRPAVKTPLDGLYLAGHWSMPGGGVYGAALSGISAAQAILGLPDQASL